MQMGKAINACVNEGMSVRWAAFHFGVPKSTLGDRMSGRVVPGSTSGPFLSPEKETELVKFLLRCTAMGYPKFHEEVLALERIVGKEMIYNSCHKWLVLLLDQMGGLKVMLEGFGSLLPTWIGGLGGLGIVVQLRLFCSKRKNDKTYKYISQGNLTYHICACIQVMTE